MSNLVIYLLAKCVREQMNEEPERVLKLSDLQAIVDKDSALIWSVEPRGPVPVRSTDGSIVDLAPRQGFFMKSKNVFVTCYEFYRGIAMHSPDNPVVLTKCEELVGLLNAKFFRLGKGSV